MQPETQRLAGILLVVYPTVLYGGFSLLRMLVTRKPYYIRSELRQRLWRAGHAHAGVLLLLSLVLLPYVDRTELAGAAATFARSAAPLAAILIPSAFFLSVTAPDPKAPNGVIRLAYAGAIVLGAGLLLIGISLLNAA